LRELATNDANSLIAGLLLAETVDKNQAEELRNPAAFEDWIHPSTLVELPLKNPQQNLEGTATTPRMPATLAQLVSRIECEDSPLRKASENAMARRQRNYRGRKVDFDVIDDLNRRLGSRGEDLVLDYERQRLTAVGRRDLAEKVKRISQTEGDGAGYVSMASSYLAAIGV
jgi:hypothetical protein